MTRLSALLAAEMMRLWEGSCNKRGEAEAHSARTVPANMKLFISYFYKMTAQKRYAPGVAPSPSAPRNT